MFLKNTTNIPELMRLKQPGVYPYFRAIETNEGPVVKIEGRDIIMAGSNNYLGLNSSSKVRGSSN